MKFNNEKDKYSYAWDKGLETNSRTAVPFAKFIMKTQDLRGSVLDLGCGNGLVVNYLYNQGFNIMGCDITLSGLNKNYVNYNYENINKYEFNENLFFEANLENLPFEDNLFDYTISCDVLEHMQPDKIDKVINEILRVTKIKTIHVIATFEDKRGGIQFHPIVQSISWWQEQFKNTKIKTELYSRKEFLQINTGLFETMGI